MDSVMLTIRTYFAGAISGGPPASVLVRLTDGDAERAFGVWLDGAAVDVRHELPGRPDATITTDTATLLSVLGDHEELPAALKAATVAVDGDRRVVQRLVSGVAVPEPAPAGARR
ncbi:MAG TPA: alkyl sulfatase C-terminal domain-containing protein [Streptosporangiaceae bacterium]